MKWIKLYLTLKSIPSILAFSQFPGSTSCRHFTPQQKHHVVNKAVKDDVEQEEESVLDKKLRDFFAKSRHFTVAKQVMDTVLTKNDDKRTKLKIPLLSKLPYHKAEYCDKILDSSTNLRSAAYYDVTENDKEKQWSIKLFDPLFENHRNNERLKSDPQRQSEIESSSSSSPLFQYISSQQSKGQNFKISIAYRGSAFCGWQIQPDNEKASVQQTLIDILDPLLGSSNIPIHNKETNQQQNNQINKSSLTTKRKPIDIRVCGRTDAGVSAIGQVCRVRTLRTSDEVNPKKIQKAINESIGVKCNDQEYERIMQQQNLSCSAVTLVNNKFHPTFGATSRAYAYIIDYNSIDELVKSCIPENNLVAEDFIQRLVHTMNKMVIRMEGLELDYFALSFGKVKTSTTLCTLYRARVSQVQLVMSNEDMDMSTCNDALSAKKHQGVCFEFVGNRFLRRMIRIMVSTLFRLALESLIIENEGDTAEMDDRFLDLVQSLDRKQSAKPASAEGLIFVGASFE